MEETNKTIGQSHRISDAEAKRFPYPDVSAEAEFVRARKAFGLPPVTIEAARVLMARRASPTETTE